MVGRVLRGPDAIVAMEVCRGDRAETTGGQALQLRAHVRDKTPDWAAQITGLEASRSVKLVHTYADVVRALLVIGGSSLFKDRRGWMASSAISCLPALTGQLGKEGAGIGPRHGAAGEGFALNDISAVERRPPGPSLPAHMSAIIDAITHGELDAFQVLIHSSS